MALRSDLKQLSKDSLIYGLSAGIGRGISIFMAPILTRIFSPNDYGVIALIQLAVGFATVLAGMNIGSGIAYYYYHFDDELARRRTLSTGFVVIFCLAFAISGMLMLFAPQVSKLLQIRTESSAIGYDLVYYLRISALGMFFALMKTGFQSLLRLMRRPKHYVIVELVVLASSVTATLILVVWLRNGVEGVFWAGVTSAFLGFICGLIFVSNCFGKVFSWTLLGMIFVYALPQVPAAFMNWFQAQLGRFFINYYATLEEQGLYSIAFQIASVLVLLTTAFRLAYDPYALSIMKREDAPQTYARLYSIYGASFGLVLGLISIFAKPILQIFTPLAYHEAHVMVFWLAGAAFYMGANNVIATGIWLSGRTIFTSYAQVFVLLTVSLANLALVPILGSEGAAIAYFIGTLTQSFSYYYFAQRLRPIPFHYWRIQGLIAAVMIISWVYSQAVLSLGLNQTLISSLSVCPIIILIVWYVGLDRTNRSRCMTWLRKHYPI